MKPPRNLRLLIRPVFSLCSLIGWAPAALAAGYALSFDGINDYVTFGPAPGLGAATFTIETWFSRQGPGISASTGFGGADAIPLVAKGRAEVDGTNQDMNYFLGIRASDGVLVADFEEGATGASPGLNHPIAGVTPVQNGIWYHAAATYDGTNWQLFLNGTLEAIALVGQSPQADSIQHASLGSALDSNGVAAGFFNGVMDEVRIWNHARSAQEIGTNWKLEISSAPGLVARWGLNEGVGLAALDSSGGGTAGTLANGPRWVGGFDPSGMPLLTRGPYLQMGTPTSMVIRWRTDEATDSRVSYGTTQGILTYTADNLTTTAEHEARLAGLLPQTRYFYSVGSTTETLASGADFSFVTAAPAQMARPTRIWVLGDSGTADANAAAVRDAYGIFNGARYTDALLMTGDNAYEQGTELEYQGAVFGMYPAILRQSVLWPALGNHDTAESSNPPLDLPYFNLFTLPTAGEAGGRPSGTEKYYSYDMANIHFICLDSMSSSRLLGGAMLTWLRGDLASTTQDWIVAYWHHPPYSKGEVVDSDTDPISIEMRQNVLPLLEAGGVDLVLLGHTHLYERSFLLNGHYGLAGTLTGSMIVNGGDGREDGTGVYRKPGGGPAANQGAVYLTIATSGDPSSIVRRHPALFTALNGLGSVVLDVNGNRLDAKFLRDTGAIDDYFSIVKDIPNFPPTISVTSPKEGAVFTAPASIAISANAADSDGAVRQVDFYAENAPIATDALAPFSITWKVSAPGYYALSAAATDNLGATTSSAAVHITVKVPPIPAAPTGLKAAARNQGISLIWNARAAATSYNVKRSTVSGGPYTTIKSGHTTTSYMDFAVTNRVTYYYVITAVNLGGESAKSNQVSARAGVTAPTAPTRPVTVPGDGSYVGPLSTDATSRVGSH